jgi:F0F1-type ATP synthase assembly protein I
MSQGSDRNSEKARTDFVLSVVNVVGLGGVAMLGIVLAALFLGLLADRFLGTKPLFTIGLLVLSAPLSIFLMLRIAMKAISKIKPYTRTESDTQGDRHR